MKWEIKMKVQLRKTALALAVTACLGSSFYAQANSTSSAIRGEISGPDGQSAAGTQITIVHVPSGTSKVLWSVIEPSSNGDGAIKPRRIPV